MEMSWNISCDIQCLSETLNMDKDSRLIHGVRSVTEVGTETLYSSPPKTENKSKPFTSTFLPIDLIPMEAFEFEQCEVSPTSIHSSFSFDDCGSVFKFPDECPKIEDCVEGILENKSHLLSYLDSCLSWSSCFYPSLGSSGSSSSLDKHSDSYWPQKELLENEALGINFETFSDPGCKSPRENLASLLSSTENKTNKWTDISSSSSSAYGSMFENDEYSSTSEDVFWPSSYINKSIWAPISESSVDSLLSPISSTASFSQFSRNSWSTETCSSFQGDSGCFGLSNLFLTEVSLPAKSQPEEDIPNTFLRHWFRNTAFTLSMIDSDALNDSRDKKTSKSMFVGKKPKAATLRTRRRQKRNKRIAEIEKIFMK